MVMNAKENMVAQRSGTDAVQEVLSRQRGSLQKFMLKPTTGVEEIQRLERTMKEEIFDQTKYFHYISDALVQI